MRDKRSKARSPLPADEQEYPEPERPTNTLEEAGQSVQYLEEPPKAEGDRYPDEPERRRDEVSESDRR